MACAGALWLLASASHPSSPDTPIEIVPGLLISSVVPTRNRSLLDSLGVAAIVNAAVADGHATHRLPGLAYLDVPLLDADCPDELCRLTSEQLARVSDFVQLHSQPSLTKRASVLVHCRKGISRSAALVLGHLMCAHNYALADALRLLRERHPHASPNHGLMRGLIEMEQSNAFGSRRDAVAPSLNLADYPPPILL